jgi:pilus assembly protein CpaF
MSTDKVGQVLVPPEMLVRLRQWLIEQVMQSLETSRQLAADESAVRCLLEDAYTRSQALLPAIQRDALLREVLDGVLGYGLIQPLLDDPTVSEIMVNGAKAVYIEREGRITRSEIVFPDQAAVLRLIDRIILPLGRRIDADSPTVDARMPDGSRVNAVIPPVAIDGPGVTIRKFSRKKLSVEDLIQLDTLTPYMAEFLRACVLACLNILVAGGTGSGKTTLLNVLSEFIPEQERIITIEDTAELQLQQEHVFRLEAKPPDTEGKGEVSIRHLVRNALRMRPDRIVVGEVRGGEALDMLQAMNTGHDGSLTTLHANRPRDAISRLETLVLLSGLNLPVRVVREQIASSIDLIVQIARLRDGCRKVTSITEVIGMEGDIVVLTELFKFVESGVRENGAILGEFQPTGMRPMFDQRLIAAGLKLSPEVFGGGVANILAANRARSGAR